ncbi:aspartate-semialdehyde dehydrogenase [bacterium]|nr:aspartate-semialdehyde dehydrogenase [bacterium]
MRIAVVGATGLVGSVMLSELACGDFDIPIDEIVPIASERSAGKSVEFRDENIPVQTLRKDSIPKVDIALFSAGANVAREFAPLFVENGAIVIDNSSAFRRDRNVPLIVPEVNFNAIKKSRLIANPNCSTIQLVFVLAPLKKFGIKSIFVSTYQAISGGKSITLKQFIKEWRQLTDLYNDSDIINDYIGAHPLAENQETPLFSNVVPAIGKMTETGEFTEEKKVRLETKKILEMPDLYVSVNAVRVPVFNGHSESVWVEFESEPCIADVFGAIRGFNHRLVLDKEFPTPVAVSGKRDVFVGRIRRDPERTHFVHLWIVADNLRKGAATNAVQIAEYICKRNKV